MNSVYLSVSVRYSISNLFCFFLLSEADIILAFNDFSGLTVDVHKYLAVVLACQNVLPLDVPLCIIFKLSLIVIKYSYLFFVIL